MWGQFGVYWEEEGDVPVSQRCQPLSKIDLKLARQLFLIGPSLVQHWSQYDCDWPLARAPSGPGPRALGPGGGRCFSLFFLRASGPGPWAPGPFPGPFARALAPRPGPLPGSQGLFGILVFKKIKVICFFVKFLDTLKICSFCYLGEIFGFLFENSFRCSVKSPGF